MKATNKLDLAIAEFETDYVPKIFELDAQKQIENQLQQEKEEYEKS